LGPPTFRPRTLRKPPGPDTYDYYSQKLHAVTAPIGAAVHTALTPFGLMKQAVDWAARTGARELYGLKVPDTMTAGQMLRDVTIPGDASRGGLGVTPEMWAKNLALYAARKSGMVPEEAIRQVAVRPTLEETLFGRLPKAAQESGTIPQQAQQLARTGAGGIQQFMADLMTDPLLPVLGAVKLPMTAAKMLGPAGRTAIPGLRQYAPDVAKVLKEAVKLPGPGAAVQRAAQAMRIRPDMATVEALTKSGLNIERATRIARGMSLQKYAHPARVWGEKLTHGGFATSMGLGALEGLDAAARDMIASGKITPEAVEAGVQAVGSGLMFKGMVGGMLGKRAMARQAVALDKKVLPAARYGTRTVSEKLPIDFVPDPLQKQAEAYASSIAERLLKEGENAGRLRLSELPQEFSEYSEAIWNQAKGEAQSITMGHSFLERIRKDHATGKAGISEERGPDGNTRLIQRDKDGKVVGAAELFHNMETGELELGTIAGGRAMGSKESMRPLYEKMDDMGVVRKEHTTILGTMARRRGAERIYPREVLEGRERPLTAEEARAIQRDFAKAGLEDVMALPAYATELPPELRRFPPLEARPEVQAEVAKMRAAREAAAAAGLDPAAVERLRLLEEAKLQEPAPDLYSQLRRVVADPKVQEKQLGEHWLRFLEKNWKTGVSGEEMRWSGLRDWLRKRGTQRVTKEQILDVLDTEGVDVRETIFRGGEAPFRVNDLVFETAPERVRERVGEHWLEVRAALPVPGSPRRAGFEQDVRDLIATEETGGEMTRERFNEKWDLNITEAELREAWNRVDQTYRADDPTRYGALVTEYVAEAETNAAKLRAEGPHIIQVADTPNEKYIIRELPEGTYEVEYVEGGYREEAATLRDAQTNIRESVRVDEAEGVFEAERVGAGEPRYETYTVPGGENYQEAILHIPPKARYAERAEPAGTAPDIWTFYDRMDRRLGEGVGDTAAEAMRVFNQSGGTGTRPQFGFRTSHWDDVDVIVHQRMKDRVGPNGEKQLILEEVQGDWGQEGREQGFLTPETLAFDRAQWRKLEAQYYELAAKADPHSSLGLRNDAQKIFAADMSDSNGTTRGAWLREMKALGEKWGVDVDKADTTTWNAPEDLMAWVRENTTRGGAEGIPSAITDLTGLRVDADYATRAGGPPRRQKMDAFAKRYGVERVDWKTADEAIEAVLEKRGLDPNVKPSADDVRAFGKIIERKAGPREERAEDDINFAEEAEIVARWMEGEERLSLPQAARQAAEAAVVSGEVGERLEKAFAPRQGGAARGRDTQFDATIGRITDEMNKLTDKWGGDIWAIPEGGTAGEKVLAGPYVESTQRWTELALKWALKKAADEGYDQVGWLRGKRQNERYNLSQVINEARFEGVPGDPTRVQIRARKAKDQQPVTSTEWQRIAETIPGSRIKTDGVLEIPREQIHRVFGKAMEKKVLEDMLPQEGAGMTRAELEEFKRLDAIEDANLHRGGRETTGKEWERLDVLRGKLGAALTGSERTRYIAALRQGDTLNPRLNFGEIEKKLLGGTEARIAKGLDLEVGGEGMREFYDRVLPSVARKVGRRWGVKVKESSFQYKDSALTYQERFETDRPAMSAREIKAEYRRLPAQLESQARTVVAAMDGGIGFQDAMQRHASSALAERFGGKMVRVDTAPEPTFVIDVPKEMAGEIRREGFPLFKAEAEAARAAEPLPMKDFLLKVYPEDSIIRNPKGDRWEVELPDGRKVEWNLGKEHIELDLAAFEEAYKRKPRPGEKAMGVTYRMPNSAVVDIVEGAQAAIPIHEHWHVLKHMGFLSKKQLRALEKKFEGNEELEADAFAEWMKRRTPNTIFEKIWDSIMALYQQVTGAPEAVFRAAERGEPLARGVAAPRAKAQTRGVIEAAVDEVLGPAGPPRLGPRPAVVPERVQRQLQERTGVYASPDGAVAVGEPLGRPRFSVRTVEDTKRSIEALNRKTGAFTKKEMTRYFRDLDNTARTVVEHQDRLDFTPSKVHRALKANADPAYKDSLDFTTMCPKRHIMQATIDAAQRKLKGSLKPEQIMEVRRALQSRGIDTACGACYVEARRANMDTVIRKAQEAIPKRLHKLLLSEEGQSELAEKHPAEYAEFRKAFAGLNIKIPEARTEYRGEILKMTPARVRAANLASGLRWQSWSDFEVPHTLDGMQAIGDMAQVGLKGQAYTKQLAFPQIFGPTGMMINMSLIPRGAGLERGKLVFDDSQSFPVVEGRRLRKKYDNVGFEVIGINDAQIKAALADPTIDYVIPYHASGLAKRFQEYLGMAEWKDYAKENTFRDRTTGKVSDKEVFWNEFEGDMAKFDRLLEERNLIPPFERMREWPGYEKLLTDRRIYGNDGSLLVQQPVRPVFDMRAVRRVMDEYGAGKAQPVGEVVDLVVKGALRRPAYATEAAPEPIPGERKPETVPTVGGVRKPPGEPPRVETRVENLQEAVAEQKKLGIPTDDLVLARELRRNWTAIDPEVQKIIIGWDDVKMIEAAATRQLTDAEVMALDAVVRGRLEQKELARMAFLERKGTNQEAEAWRDYAEAIAKYVPLERANVNDGSGAGRALAARARIMEAAQTPDRKFLKKALAELEGLTNKDAEMLVRMFETGDPRLADAMRAYSSGFWKQWQTLLRAMLITPSSEVPNIIGNSIVQGVEIADSAVAAGLDWAVTKARGKPRERYIGELGAELSGWIEAGPAAMGEFLKERFAGIYKRAWTGESLPVNLEKRLEYQVSPFKTKLPRLIATSLDALGAGDQLFRSIIARGLAKKWAYRLSHQQAKRGATKEQIANRGDEILFDLFQRPQKYPEVLQKIRSDTARRLFQGKPWKIVEHLRGMERDWPWLAAALPFVRTPANIARYGIHHSPMGFLTPEAMRALRVLATGKETYRKGGIEQRMTQGEASDIVASRLVGTAIFGMAVLAAKAGKITGSGPSDWKERKAKMETGWRPYSFVVQIDGRNYYIPYARFDPVAQVMGVAADVAEMKHTRTAEDMASKAMGSIMENFTDRTYLKGLIDFTEALNDPLRFAGQYAVGIATMHIPRQVARVATAIDPVIRDVRPLDRSMMGLPKRLQNSVIRNIPWASKTLAARRGPTGEEIVRPGGMGIGGKLMRTFSPIQVSPERPGRELEALMAEIGGSAVPGEQKPYITIQGEQIMLEREDLETLSKADRSAAHELRRFMRNPAFNRLPDTIEEGGKNSKEGVIRDTYRRHRDYARQAMLRSRRFRRMAMAQLREKRRAG
jgi:hypothetical protein